MKVYKDESGRYVALFKGEKYYGVSHYDAICRAIAANFPHAMAS